jgi:predicted XRE-type DNA-binding protein
MKKSSKVLEGGPLLAGAQLGLREETVRLKTLCAVQLNEYLDKLGWTQQRIGSELGLSQPHVSELRNYALDRFSADRLLQFMAAMGLSVQIRIESANDDPDRPALDAVTIDVPPIAKSAKKVA